MLTDDPSMRVLVHSFFFLTATIISYPGVGPARIKEAPTSAHTGQCHLATALFLFFSPAV